ncbi:MAG: amino acid permease [Sphingomonadaceae bacterium]|nr:amino acid permease [Sphingomonadaceae bacterium]
MTVSLVVGNMIGSGIFLLPVALAPLGWNSVGGWLLTVAGGLCIAATFCWLVRAIPREGGPYVYTREAFGPLPAFMVTWSYWISLWIGNAAIAVAGVSYISVFLPFLSTAPGAAAVAACVLIWGVSIINLSGTRAAGGFQLVTTVIKLIPLVVVILLAALAIASGEAAPRPLAAGELSAPAITAAATLTLWALLGLESATVPAGKIRDPQRTIPFATLTGTALTGLVYLITCSAIVLLMPAETIAGSSAPFADFVTRFWAPEPALFIALFAAIACIGALNGWVLVLAELPFAMARAGAFPAWFGKQTAAGAPARSLIVSSGLMTAVVLLNYQRSATEIFAFLILLSTATTLFMYLACALAALKLSGRLPHSRLMIGLAAVATVYAVWTIYGAGGEAVGWGVALLALGVPVHFAMRKTARDPR